MPDIKNILLKESDFKWVIPRQSGMNVPGVLYLSEALLDKAIADNAVAQVISVAKLPGIVKHSLAMPDVHWGYGAPIGGVGAFDAESGMIVPGFVGYDINCGVRLLRTNLEIKDIEHRKEEMLNALFQAIPSGVGSTGKVNLKKRVLKEVLLEGASWAIKQGFASNGDLDYIEEGGRLEGADPEALSDRAIERGLDQLETLGSGNHFLEIQRVEEIYDQRIAGVFGLFDGQITVMIHTGSRGLGYQVCDDFLSQFSKAVVKYGISVPDRQLVCAPVGSYEGKKYLSAMKCAVNYAFANRQIISHRTRETFMQILRLTPNDLGMHTVYDVAHNICKLEIHTVEGQKKKLYVHRKGATRAFPAGHPDLPERYRPVGQPVITPGSMGTASYVLVGMDKAMEETWGSTCHGAGRVMSRNQAVKEARGRSIAGELAQKGILALADSKLGLAEEMPQAYKDIAEVIRVVEGAGLARKVARLVPLAVMKG